MNMQFLPRGKLSAGKTLVVMGTVDAVAALIANLLTYVLDSTVYLSMGLSVAAVATFVGLLDFSRKDVPVGFGFREVLAGTFVVVYLAPCGCGGVLQSLR